MSQVTRYVTAPVTEKNSSIDITVSYIIIGNSFAIGFVDEMKQERRIGATDEFKEEGE